MPKPPPPIKGIIFDLDGTLYTANFFGLTIAWGFIFEPIRLRKIFKVRTAERHKTYADETAFKNAFSSALARETGMTETDALNWYESRFMPRFTHAIRVRGRRRSGLVSLLQTLRQRGVKLAVVSDFGWIEERLKAIDLSPDLFDEIATAESFGAMKPTAKPFLHIAKVWRIPIEEILLVGDRVDHDEQSATLAGAQFIGITGSRKAGEDYQPWPQVRRYIDSVTLENNT